MGAFETANELAILAGARSPTWAVPNDSDGTAVTLPTTTAKWSAVPSSPNAGLALGNVLVCGIDVTMRENAAYRTVRVTIGVFDAATTYTVTIAGNAANASAANLAALLVALTSAIHALAGVTAAADPDDATKIRIIGDTSADYTAASSVAGGTGTISLVADPTDAVTTFWMTQRGSHPTSGATFAWKEYIQADHGPIGGAVETNGILSDVPVNGKDRIYCQLSGVTGTGDGGTIAYKPTVMFGPYTLEGI